MAGPIFVVSGITIIGILCTFFAPQLQRLYMRWPPPFKWSQRHIESRSYVWELRIIGIISLAVGLYHFGKIILH
jgi:hypothetical protein